MNHIFISYQRASEARVTDLAGRLRADGLDVWQDLSGKETGIPYSVKWWEVIRSALYSAAGALIIKTEPWKESGPCSDEYQLIQANLIPNLIIEENEFGDMEALTKKVHDWYDREAATEDNLKRTYLFTQAYRIEQDRKINHLLPGKIGVFEAKDQYRRFSGLTRYLKKSGIMEEAPEAGKRMTVFLSKAKHKILREQAVRLLAVGMGIAGIVMLVLAIRVLPHLLKNAYESDYRGKTTAAIDLIRDISTYDPVSSISLMTSDPAAGNFDETRAFFFMQSTMADLLSLHYPADFYAAETEEAAAVRQIESPPIPISFDGKTGTFTAEINGTATSYTADCAPGAACYLEERNELLAAADRIIRAYDLDGAADGIPLIYNFEEIDRIAAQGDRIYGITKSGNVVVWENPIPEKTVRRKLSEGTLLQDGTAAYTEGESLILQREGREEIFPLPVTATGAIAVSRNGKAAAAAGRDSSGQDRVVLINTENGEILAAYEAPGDVTGLAFSDNGRWVYGVTFQALLRMDITGGKTETADAEPGSSYYTVTCRRDLPVVGTTDGMVAQFGSDLRRQTNWAEITLQGLPAKQLAVSDLYGTVFAACRGGNTIAGCRRINLETGAIHRLALEAEEGMPSSNCAAVSPDGEFVAYGFPNGRVTVWSTDTLNKLLVQQPAAEPIIAVRFENDGLNALGKSGTVYRTEFGGLVRKVETETVTEYWNAYTEKAGAVHRRMYELGLTYITP